MNARGDGVSRRERLFVPLAAAAYVAAAFLTDPPLFRATDFVKDWLPNRVYLLDRLRAGELPLWNPYLGLGRPALAAIDTSTFYPPGWLLLPLGLHGGVVALTMAHFALAALGTVRLGAALGLSAPGRWLAAAAFAGSNYLFMVVHSGGIQYAWGACYLPLALLLAARAQDAPSLRRVAALALTLALQLLCGYPQIAWITWMGAGAFLVGRSLMGTAGQVLRLASTGLGALAAGLAWAFALSAVQLLPLFELVAQSNRAAPTVAGAAEGSFPWSRWLSLVVPADAVSHMPMLSTLFLGVPVVLAGLCGLSRLGDRNVRGLVLAGVLAVLVAAGDTTPAFGLLFHLIPGLSSFHFHGRAAIVVMVALALGAGVFVTSRPWRRGPAVVAVLAALLALATVGWHARVVPPPARSATWLGWRLAVIALSAAALIACLRAAGQRTRQAALAAVALLTAAELALAAGAIKRLGVLPGPFPGERHVLEVLGQAGLLRPGAPPPRVALPYPVIRDNSGSIHRYSTISAYVPLGLERVWGYMHEVLALPYPVGQNEFPSPALFQFGPLPYPTMNIVLGLDPRSGALQLNQRPDPRAYVAGAAQPVANWREAVQRMRGGHDVQAAPLVEGTLEQALAGPPGTARIVRFAPEAITLEVEAAGPSLLVLSEPWYPGWTARVNGAAAACLPANAWMRAVPVPAGPSRVEVEYRSTRLALGAAVSLAALLALGAALARPRASSAAS